MPLTGVHFLISYQCTHECDHCFVWASPQAGGTITLERLTAVLDQAVELGSISDIYFEGGELLGAYDPRSHPIIGPLVKGGPAERVRVYDLPHEDGYVDVCHLCYEARSALRARFTEVLGPPNVCGEEGPP